MKRTLLLLSSVTVLAGCASTPSNPQDPLEPMNRAVFGFNETADRAVLKPVAEAYRFVTPQPVRSGISNFFDNIRDVYSIGNHALQGEGKKTATDILRVGINSTFGLFGLIDLATPMGLPSYKATLGDTFAHYGWQNSSYLVLPFYGPTTVRDGTGMIITQSSEFPANQYGTQTRIAVASVINVVNIREQLLGVENLVEGAALDKYSYVRDGYLQIRNRQLGQSPVSNPDDDNIDDLVDTDASAAAASAPAATAP